MTCGKLFLQSFALCAICVVADAQVAINIGAESSQTIDGVLWERDLPFLAAAASQNSPPSVTSVSAVTSQLPSSVATVARCGAFAIELGTVSAGNYSLELASSGQENAVFELRADKPLLQGSLSSPVEVLHVELPETLTNMSIHFELGSACLAAIKMDQSANTTDVVLPTPAHPIYCLDVAQDFFDEDFAASEVVFESESWLTEDDIGGLRLAKATSDHGPDDDVQQRQFVFDFISEADNLGVWQDLQQTYEMYTTYRFSVLLGASAIYMPYSSFVSLEFRDQNHNVLAIRTIVTNALTTTGYDKREVILEVEDNAGYIGQPIRVAIEFGGSGISAAMAGVEVCVMDAPTTTSTTSTSSTSTSTSSTSSTSSTTSTSSTSSTTAGPCELAGDYSFEAQFTQSEKLFDASSGWTLRSGTDARLLRAPSPLAPTEGITGSQFLVVGASDDDRPGLYQTLTRPYFAGQLLELSVDMGRADLMTYSNFVSLEFLDDNLEPRAVRTFSALTISQGAFSTYSLQFRVPCDIALQEKPMRVGLMFSGSSLSVALDNVRVCIVDRAVDVCAPTTTSTTSTSSTSSTSSTTSTSSTSTTSSTTTPSPLNQWVCDSPAASSYLDSEMMVRGLSASLLRIIATPDCSLTSIPSPVTSVQGMLHLDSKQFSTRMFSNLQRVESEFYLRGLEYIRDLRDFANLANISGTSYLNGLRGLTNTGGMNLLTMIGGLRIEKNHRLVSVKDFKALVHVRGDLEVVNNDRLIRVESFDTITQVGMSLRIMKNARLLRIPRFESMVRIGSELKIANNLELAAIAGFSSMLTAGDIEIADNALRTITGFDKLVHCNSLRILSNNQLTTFNAMSRLQSVDSTILLSDSPQLKNVSGFESLTRATYIGFRATALREIPAFSSFNASLSLVVSDNPKLEHISGFPAAHSCSLIRVSNNANLQNLTGFGCLTVGSVTISLNKELSHIGAFEAMERSSPRSSFSITTNNALKDAPAFPNWNVSGGRIMISTNAYLGDISGFTALVVTQTLEIMYNVRLEQISGFGSLATAESISLQGNRRLKNITGLSSLNKTLGLTLKGNTLLSSAPGLQSLQFIGERGLDIIDNGLWCPYDDLSGVKRIDGPIRVNDVPSDCDSTQWAPEMKQGCTGTTQPFWCLQPAHKLFADNGTDGMGFGTAVAVDAETVMVGAPESGQNGEVFIYRAGDTWKIDPEVEPGTTADIKFGSAVAMQGSTIVIGAPDMDGRGKVYAYEFTGSNWSRTSVLEPSAVQPRFGSSLSMTRSRLVVGAPHSGANAAHAGSSAYIFYILESQIVYDATILAPEAAQGDRFGSSVQVIKHDQVAIGAPGVHNNTGAVYIFTSDSAVQKLETPFNDTQMQFGSSLAAYNEQYLIVGSPNAPNPDSGSATGAVFVYFSTPVGFDYMQMLTPGPDAPFGSAFGSTVALSAAGAFIGAPGNGAAYGFPWSSPSFGHPYKIELLPDDEDGSSFAQSIAAGGNRVLVAAPNGAGHVATDGYVQFFGDGL